VERRGGAVAPNLEYGASTVFPCGRRPLRTISPGHPHGTMWRRPPGLRDVCCCRLHVNGGMRRSCGVRRSSEALQASGSFWMAGSPG
jgi:hypothetical protein